MGNLSEHRIKALTAPGRYSDGDNLYLSVSRTGRKTWAFLYARGGRPRQMGLGPVALTKLKDAREQAIDLRRMLRDGIDPIDARKKAAALPAPKVVTFKEVAEDCVTALAPKWTNKKSEPQWRSTLATYVYPSLGEMDVAKITTDDVYRVLEPIWVKKAETATRLRARIETVLNRASARKLRTGDNPARLTGNLDHLLPTQSKVKRVKHHAALPYTDLAAFMADLRRREGIAPRALEFAILTAARTTETIEARWSEIDMEAGIWSVPAERMKARRDHRVPLSKSALALLKTLPRDAKSDFVFISPNNPGKPMSNMALLAILKRMKRRDITTHGFRSAFRDWAAETTAYPDAVVEMALAHAIGNAVEAAYRRGDLFDKRTRLMADWASFCERSAGATGSVVAIRA